jgi:cytochrome P450
VSIANLRLQGTNPDPSLSESFAGYLLKNRTEHGLSDDEMAYLAGSMFGAGSDTSAAAITNTIQAAILYPRFAVILREEMRRAFPKGPPTLDELLPKTTPFLHAYVYESLRWRPVSAPGQLYPMLATLP